MLPHIRWEILSCIFFSFVKVKKWKSLSCVQLFVTQASSLSLLQWIFPVQESNQSLLHYRRILYQLSYHRSPLFCKGWQLSKHMRTLFLSKFLYNFPRLPAALQVCFFSSFFLYMWWWWWWFSRLVRSKSCDPVDCNRPGSSIHGILQARILERVAVSFSRGSSRPTR